MTLSLVFFLNIIQIQSEKGNSKTNHFLGPPLPHKLRDAMMIPTPTEKGVILVGGYNDSHRRTSNLLLELNGRCLASLRWNITELRMKFQRSYHVALTIPDHLTTLKTNLVAGDNPIRDFTLGSINRASAQHRGHDPKYSQSTLYHDQPYVQNTVNYNARYGPNSQNSQNGPNPAPHLTQYCSSGFKFPFYSKSTSNLLKFKTGKSWQS